MADEQRGERRQHSIPTISAIHLEEDELEYELMIRNLNTDPAADEQSLVDRLNAAINREIEDETDPVSIGPWNDNAEEEEVNAEIILCQEKVFELHGQVTDQYTGFNWADFPATDSPATASRIRHYECRLRRLPDLTSRPMWKRCYDVTLKTIDRAYLALATLVSFRTNGQPSVRRDERQNSDFGPPPLNSTTNESSTSSSNTASTDSQSTSTTAASMSTPPTHSVAPTNNSFAHATFTTTAHNIGFPNHATYNGVPPAMNSQPMYSMANPTAYGAPYHPIMTPHAYPVSQTPAYAWNPTQMPTQSANGIPPTTRQVSFADTVPTHNYVRSNIQASTANVNGLFPPYDGHALHGQMNRPDIGINIRPEPYHYHPATTPRREIRNTPANYGVSTSFNGNRSQLSAGPVESRQFYQEQQSLRKWLGHRYFDGTSKSDSKTMNLDEFIRNIKHFQESARVSDESIIRNLSSCFTGSAFTWWDNQRHTIPSLIALEQKLRIRFARQTTDPMAIIAEVSSRKQMKDESLLDFIDVMQQLMQRSPTIFSEDRQVEAIVNNSREEYNRVLIACTYANLEELHSHASYLERHLNKSHRSEVRIDARRVKKVATLDACDDEEEVAEDGEEPEASSDEILSKVVNALSQKLGKTWKRPNKFTPKSAHNDQAVSKPVLTDSKDDVRTQFRPSVTHSPEICKNCYVWGHRTYDCVAPKNHNCYGCGQPNTYKSECQYCNSKVSSTELMQSKNE